MPGKNVKYQYKWKGIRTNWDYLIEFIPADTASLNNPTIIELPAGTLISLSYSYKYDKFPLGMPEVPSLNIEISLNEIPPTNEYIEFKNAVLNPAMLTSWTFWFDDKFVKFEFTIGTIVNLFVKPNGFEDYFHIFQGIVKSIDKLKYSIENKKVTFEAENICKHVLESFDFTGLKIFSDYLNSNAKPYAEGYGILEFLNTSSNPSQVVEHYKNWHIFRFRGISFLFDYIQTISQEVARISTRGLVNQINFTSTLPFLNLYKQTYNKSGQKGAQITEPYIIVEIVFQEVNQETMVDGICRAFQETYKNSVWDFIREYSEWQISSAFVFNNLCIFAYLLGNNELFLELSPRSIKSVEIELNKNRVKTVTASLYENFNGEKYSDISDYNAVKTGTLNQDEISIPIVFNNMPTAVEYKHFKNPGQEVKQAFVPHVRNLYYYEPGYGFLRVHEYCEYYITDTLLSSSLPNCEFSPFNYNQQPFSKFENMIVALQSTNCMPKWASQTVLEVFSKVNQSYLKLSVPIEEISHWQSGQFWMLVSKLPWLIPLCNIKFPLSTLDANLPPLEKWKVIESNVNFSTETADFQLISILV